MSQTIKELLQDIRNEIKEIKKFINFDGKEPKIETIEYANKIGDINEKGIERIH